MVNTDSFEAVVDGRKQASSVTVKVGRSRSDEFEPVVAEFMESVGRSQSDG